MSLKLLLWVLAAVALIDPAIRMLTPETNFFVLPGAPPGLARFEGPRNFAGQKIRIE